MSELAIEEKARLHRTTIGFWGYLMTDCMVFASLFATYVVLRPAIAGGPAGKEIFDLPLVLIETVILLTSSFSCGIALVGMRTRQHRQMIAGFLITFVLGAAFLTIEISEFVKLIAEGHGPGQSAFLSGYFTLVGTHGLHILVGLLWLGVILAVLKKRGMTSKLSRQITLFGMFWHFLDLVWIFIFTIVYMTGVLV